MQGVGLSQDDSFHLTIGQDCLGLVGCFIAWWIMTRFGRRPIYLVGLSAIFVILMIVGFIGLAPPTNKSASLAGGVLIILMIFCFQVSSPIHRVMMQIEANSISFPSDPSAIPSLPKSLRRASV
jgi:SP family general alpha glucoside:H+ symporter-like MFS transporter